MALLKGTTGRISLKLKDQRTGGYLDLATVSEILLKLRRDDPANPTKAAYIASLTANDGTTATLGGESYVVDKKCITVDIAAAGECHATIPPTGMDLVQANDGGTDVTVLALLLDGTVLGQNLPAKLQVESQLV